MSRCMPLAPALPQPASRMLALLASSALVCVPSLLTTGVAWAQDAGQPASAVAPSQVPDDGLVAGSAYIEADQVTRDGDVISASANADQRVLARYDGITLRAGEVRLDLAQGSAVANNNVEFVDADGNSIFASYLALDQDQKAGLAVDFATRFQNGASLMAATVVRRSDTRSELNYALFTPCPICDEDGNARRPSVSIQAEQVVQDEGLRAILYRNALFRVGGVPVLYLPWFAHPDPTVERATGFLTPYGSYDRDRGFSLEVPYYLVTSPSEDWLFGLQLNSEVSPLLNLQWRRHFRDGLFVARSGYTYARNFGDFDADNNGIDDIPIEQEHRSYILAHGRFDPDGPWRWGFTLERTSDKTLFDRYDIRDPYQDNGLYYGDERRLISQIYVEHQTARSYVSLAAFDIQSLRVAQVNDTAPGLNVFEADSSLPVVAPLVEARWEPTAPIFGGRVRLRGSAVSLYRDAYVGSPVLRPGAIPPVVAVGDPGVDTTRVTAQADWRRTLISPMGLRWDPFVDLRFDGYAMQELPASLGLSSESVMRGRASVGLNVSYPMIRPMRGGGSMIMEPQAQLSYSTEADQDPLIPNEDSHTIELDESSLFRMDRFPGFDLIEGGLRLTLGNRMTWRWDDEREASLFIGRSFRTDEEPGLKVPIPDSTTFLYDPTGLAEQSSDWVVQTTVRPTGWLRGWGHATFDGSGDMRRGEAALDGRWGRRNMGSLTYIVDRSNPLAGPLNRNYEFAQVSAQQFVYGNWGLVGVGVFDLERDLITRSEVGLLFDDECFRFEIGFRRDNTRVRPSGPSEGIYLRLNLATFGGTGYGRDNRSW